MHVSPQDRKSRSRLLVSPNEATKCGSMVSTARSTMPASRQLLRYSGSVVVVACLSMAQVIGAEPPTSPPEPPAPQPGQVSPPPAPKDPSLDIPATGLDLPGAAEGQNPKQKKKVDQLWQLPPTVPNPVTPPPPTVTPSASTEPVTETSAPLRAFSQGDPATRAELTRPMTPAESLIDGLGGMPAPLETIFPKTGIRPQTGKIFKIGPLTVHPAFNAGVTYQTITRSGMQNTGKVSRNPESNDGGSYFSPTAGMTFSGLIGTPESGHTMSILYGLQYGAGGNEGNGASGDTQPFNQQLSIFGQLDFTKLRLGIGVGFASLSGANRDFGGNVDRQLLSISLTSSYALTPKTSLNWDVSIPIRQVNGGLDSTSLNSTVFFNYAVSPKTELGLGIGGGIEKVKGEISQTVTGGRAANQGGNTQTYQQLIARGSFRPSSRLSLAGNLGLEFREAASKEAVNPIFGLNIQWTLREGTSIGLTASQIVQSSASTAGADYLSTSLTIGASQRLGYRMSLQLSVGYERAKYSSIASDTTINRVDNLYTGQAGLSFSLSARWSASLAYLYSLNKSTRDGFESSSGQFQMNFQF